MALFELGMIALVLGLALGVVLLLFAMFFVYTKLDRKLHEKLDEADAKDREIREHVTKVNEARLADKRDVAGRLDAIDERLAVLLSPEGEEKELAKEKIMARASK